ncbi:MAG: phosphoglycerate kinase [Bacilli bacterium]|nr:phosphoglycerate kinase [Bacilli bacterium]
MKKTIQNTNVRNKTILLRVDYNVPLQNGKILDDTKIIETLETIRYLQSENCKIVILSHLGKIKTEEDKSWYSLEVVADRLKELLRCEVYFSKENFTNNLKNRVELLKPQEILILENTRFLDLPNRLESSCDAQLSMFWASLGDVFVNDAFASSHRRHASTYGIATYLPSCIGFLMQKEIISLNKLIQEPEKPFVLIMGGAKVEDKIQLIQKLITKCDYLLCGGGIANTCLKALDVSIGESLSSQNATTIRVLQQIMLENKTKFVLPLDAIVGTTYDNNEVKYKRIDKIEENDIILDVGIKTLEKYQTILQNAKTIFINGTLGKYEDNRFANGTKELFEMLQKTNAIVVAGGGDTQSALKQLKYQDKFTYVSSGGGATLEYLATGSLIALENITEEDSIETLDL